jgi:glycerol-3-phosphate dehydrogenase
MTAAVRIARSLDDIDGQTFDVVIAGAGIYGALSAVEAAHQGMRTLLVDRTDFGAGASFKSLRTIHGGLRYLQRLDFPRARASSLQRDWWLANFPDLVESRPFLMPLYGRGLRGPAAFRAAAVLARLLRLNSAGLPAERRLPALQLIGASEVRERFAGIPTRGLRAGALWFDAFMPESSRIVIESIRWAVSAGARPLNYVELTGAQPERAGRSMLTLTDRVSGARLTVTTRAVINATGSSVDEVASRIKGRRRSLLLPTIAWNLLLEASPPGSGCLALTPPRRGAQTYFLHAFHGRVLVGTGHAAAAAGDAGLTPSTAMVQAMRADLDAAYPDAGLGQAKVLRVLADVLPGVRPNHAQLAMRPRIVRDSAGGGAALWHVVGVKFTEAPDVARRVVQLACSGNRAQLRPRPASAGGWDVFDRSQPMTRAALLDLAESESVLYLEDLTERRTNAWCDTAMQQRLENLVGQDFAEGPPTAYKPVMAISRAIDR